MVRPFIAAMLSSTNPLSLSVSVWIVTATSCSSANPRQASMAEGVVPQSSCSLKPAAPASKQSLRTLASEVLPFPLNPKFMGIPSVALSIISNWVGAGVQVVAEVPAEGPVPPPNMVVNPEAMASSNCWGQMKWTWVSMPPAVRMSFSPAITSVVAPTTMFSSTTPSIMSGFPAFPIPTMRLPLMPMSALMMPRTLSTIKAFVTTTSSATSEVTLVDCPMPSRRVLPPPNLHSSP
mmetsp:Transcript_21341/g.44955  ORF Transcript_21341/g.44955 Transcript_21341/m.44955 type:complete len:235 (+) Transcript_21341:473-1177(+)